MYLSHTRTLGLRYEASYDMGYRSVNLSLTNVDDWVYEYDSAGNVTRSPASLATSGPARARPSLRRIVRSGDIAGRPTADFRDGPRKLVHRTAEL